MGNTGSRLKKLRKSLRRMSLSRSRDHLERTDQTRRSRSLMNLSVSKKNVIHKKKSRSTILVSESREDEAENQEIPKNERVPMMRKFSSCILHIKKLGRNKSTKDLKTRSQEGLERGETKFYLPITDINTPTEDIIIDSGLQDDGPIPKEHSSEESSNDSYVSTLEESSDKTQETLQLNKTEPVSGVIYNENDCIGVIALKKIDEALHDLEHQMETMSHEDLLAQLSSFKDEIHTLWKMSYDVKDSSDEVHPKKANTIEYTKYLLHKLFSKAFKQHDYRVSESSS